MIVLLINPYSSFSISMYPALPPLGLAIIGGVLREEGHSVEILDINIFGLSKKQVEHQLKTSSYDIVGITTYLDSFPYLQWLTSVIKEISPTVDIILGGPLVTSLPEIILTNTEATIGVIGEGEKTVIELLTAIKEKKDLKSIPGLIFKNEGKIETTRLRDPTPNLDTVPFPNWDLFPLDIYFNIEKFNIRYSKPRIIKAKNSQLLTMTSRGCPFNCDYCSRIFGRKVRWRSVEKVVQELKYYKEKYNLEAVYFRDDNFTLNNSYAVKLCESIIKAELELKWDCVTSVTLVDKELLKLMKQSNCTHIGYGIESLNPEILNKVHKPITVDHIKRAIRETQAVGIKPIGFIIVGLPGETEETLKTTVKFAREVGIKIYANQALPIPNSALFELAKSMGKITNEVELLQDFGYGTQNRIFVNFTDLPDEVLLEAIKELNSIEKEDFCDPITSSFLEF